MKMTPAIYVPAVLALAPVSLLAAEADTPQQVEVVGRRSSGSYHALEASGSKTGLTLRELPQAVRVMARQSLDDLGAVRLDDALDYAGGVSRQNNFGGMWDNIAIRGLAGDINSGMALLHNGFAGNRGFNPPRDTANIERIEFLKGAAASLYGASEPGGTLNIVSKSPLWRSARSIEAYAGSDGFRRAVLDATGPAGEGAAYRLNAAVEERGSFREHVESRRALLAPAFTLKLGPATTVDYRGEALRHAAPLDRGVAAVGGRPGAIPRERFLGEPADGDIRMNNVSHQLVVDHQFDEQWSARAAVSAKQASMRGFSTEAQSALQPDGRTLRRQRRYRDFSSGDIALQAELAGRIRSAGLTHQLLIGIEAYRFDLDQRMLRANPSAASPYAIDIFAPVYGQPQPQPLPNTDTREAQRNRALYVQDAISLGQRWRVVAGARIDRYEQTLHNLLSGATTSQQPSSRAPRLGLSYLPGAQWTVFANAGRSFRPNSGSSVSGAAFTPEHGRALEAGVKWESADHAQGATVALFDIRKRDVLTADPANPGYSATTGAVSSRGLDADYAGRLGAHWRVNASLSLIDARVRADRTLEAGARLLNVPRVNGSLLMVHESRAGAHGRVAFGGGLTFSGKRLGEARTQAQADAGSAPFELPGYALAKAVAYWQASRRLRLSLDIDNLFDRSYYASSYQRTWIAPGQARSVTLGAHTTF